MLTLTGCGYEVSFAKTSSRLVRLDVQRTAVEGAPERLSRAVGQQPRRLGRLLLEDGEPRPPRRQADSAQ
jgi:hypothetical protein